MNKNCREYPFGTRVLHIGRDVEGAVPYNQPDALSFYYNFTRLAKSDLRFFGKEEQVSRKSVDARLRAAEHKGKLVTM